MWPRTSLLPTCLWVLLLHQAAPSSTNDRNIHSLISICEDYVQWEEVISTDAIIRVKEGDLTGTSNTTCSMVLKTFRPNTLMVKVTDSAAVLSDTPCIMYLTVTEPWLNNTVLGAGCLLPPGPSSPLLLVSTGSEVRLVFTLVPAADRQQALQAYFSVVVAALIPTCRGTNHFWCGDYCIHPDLVCDGVQHCPQGEDEPSKLCLQAPTAPARGAPPPRARSTALPPGETTGSPGGLNTEENIYLWLPLLVVVVFTVVMLALILAGRRAGGCSDREGEGYTRTAALLQVVASPATSNATTVQTQLAQNSSTTLAPSVSDQDVDIITIVLVAVVFLIILVGCLVLGFREQRHRSQEQTLNNGLHIETHTNAAISDGAPATPPPTYSMIERQTSYVSQISQTSSQISVPPAYEDAVDEADDPMSWRRRIRRHLSRSRSVTSGPSRRHRLFQRSLSAQEAPQGRYSAEPAGGRARNPSDPSDARGHPSVSSDTDSVFEDPSSHGNNSAPGVLENVTEVDESLDSSTLMLANEPRVVVTNGAEPANTVSTTAQLHSRPVLQRSISDVTGENTHVTFSLGEG